MIVLTAVNTTASLPESQDKQLSNTITINAFSSNAQQQLQQALCSTVSSSSKTCVDNTKKTIKINGIIDFTNIDGQSIQKGCVYSNNQCIDTKGQEKILDVQYYCNGKSLINININIAGQKPLLVGSNKTIIGVSKHSGVKGKGLLLRGGSNIIIKNINITDINEQVIWGGDAITVDNASNVLIDHNYFARIGRQFVVTGWGSARNVVISNNNFDGKTGYGHYCDNRHYWNFLFLGSNQTITLKQNWIHDTSGRAPELGQSNSASGLGLVHIINNLYQSNYYMGVRTSNKVLAFVEANDFDNTNNLNGHFRPIFKESADDLIFAPYSNNLAQANTYCSSKIGRSCIANIYSNYTPNDSFELNSNALSLQYDIAIRQFVGLTKPMNVNSVKKFVIDNAGPQ